MTSPHTITCADTLMMGPSSSFPIRRKLYTHPESVTTRRGGGGGDQNKDQGYNGALWKDNNRIPFYSPTKNDESR